MTKRTHLSGSLAEDGVDERHDGGLEVHLIPVTTCAPVQVSHETLEARDKSTVTGILIYGLH